MSWTHVLSTRRVASRWKGDAYIKSPFRSVKITSKMTLTLIGQKCLPIHFRYYRRLSAEHALTPYYLHALAVHCSSDPNVPLIRMTLASNQPLPATAHPNIQIYPGTTQHSFSSFWISPEPQPPRPHRGQSFLPFNPLSYSPWPTPFNPSS